MGGVSFLRKLSKKSDLIWLRLLSPQPTCFFVSPCRSMTSSVAMPVAVNDVNYNEVKPIPEHLRARLDVEPKTSQEIGAESARLTARSQALRQAHLEAVKERAARETQRAEEAAARKRALAEAEAQKVLAKLNQASERVEQHRLKQQEKREGETARRQALAEAATSARQRAEEEREIKGRDDALRTSRASERGEQRVAAVAKRSSLALAKAIKKAKSVKERALVTQKATTADEDEMPLDDHLLGSGDQAPTDRCEPAPPSPHPTVVPLAVGLSAAGAAVVPSLAKQNARSSSPRRQSPRRAPSPNLPSICEDLPIAKVAGDTMSHGEKADEIGMHKTMIDETLSAITRSNSYNPFEKSDASNGQQSKIERAFERGVFRTEARSPGKTKRCYEVVWADGSRRKVDW